jgi:peptidoglycan/xylan/chitin deacetylase (PgdA/CDA1 family)
VLRLLGCSILPLREYVQLRRAFELPPARAVVLTIDDGYVDTLEVAMPVLRRMRAPASVFAVSGKLGGGNDWTPDGPLHARPLLPADGLRRLAREGVEIESHTRSHPSLVGIAPESALDELAGSRADLETLLGHPVPCVAYPYGDVDGQAVRLAEQAGYSAACVADGGFNDARTPLHALNRIEVHGDEGLWRFLAKVFGWTG